MSYLKYSNLCADMLRSALKEPAKAKAKAKEVIYFRTALWKNGVPEKQGEHLPGRGRRRRCRRMRLRRRSPTGRDRRAAPGRLARCLSQ